MSEGADEGQEKSFDASETKIKKSRDKGDVPQSTETNTLMLYISLAVTIFLFGGVTTRNIFSELTTMITHPHDLAATVLQGQNGEQFGQLLTNIGMAAAPLFLIPVAFILGSLIVQRAIVIAPDKIIPKISRISPISNAKQKYGTSGLVEFGKRLLKTSFITIIGGVFFYQAFFNLAGLSGMPKHFMLYELQTEALKLTLYMIIAMGLITFIDLPYAQFEYLKKLRMTFQELKDESKENEGDPHMKRERQLRAQAISRSTMLKDVATANVVIVNPTHYAVALKWSRSEGEVPICVAKGIDLMAARIREEAEKHDVAIYSNPPCARSLHALVDIGEAIRYEHYAAVAAAIHFADQAKTKPY